MGSDVPLMASNYDEIFMQNSLQFAESLKDLKNLRKQLYSAAEYFESSYDKDDHQQVVIESSKDYVAKAIVSTVDHLGSVAEKLNKFLDEKANEFSATTIKFSCLQQRLSTFNGFIDLRGVSKQSLIIEANKHHKQYIVPAVASFESGKSELIYRSCITSAQYDIHQPKQDNPFAKAFHVAQVKPQPQSLREGCSRVPSSEPSPNPFNFSLTRVMSKKETGKLPGSPLHIPFKRSVSVANRPVSPSPSNDKHRFPSMPRRALHTKPEMGNKEQEIVESYTKRSKYLFKALFNAHRLFNTHRSTKENHTLQMIQR